MLFGFGLQCLGIFFNSNEFTSSRIFFLVVYILRELTEYKMGEFLYTKTLSHYTFHLYLGLKKERKGRKGRERRDGGREEGRKEEIKPFLHSASKWPEALSGVERVPQWLLIINALLWGFLLGWRPLLYHFKSLWHGQHCGSLSQLLGILLCIIQK